MDNAQIQAGANARMSEEVTREEALTPEQFEIAKLDYARLWTQEQSIMDSRLQVWLIFFTVVGGPTGYVGVVGLRGSVFLLALIPFFVACLSLHVKHGEMVLKNDIRKHLKAIASQCGYQNHESRFSKQAQKERRRFWHGWYRLAMGAAFVVAELVCALFVCWYSYVNGLQTLSVGMAVGDALLIAITGLCLLFG